MYGNYSIENFTFLLILKILYPKNIYLNRSEFESHNLTNVNGLIDQQIARFKIAKEWETGEKTSQDIMNYNRIYNILLAFNLTFSVLPLATIIGKNAFVINFGLPRENYSIDQLMLLDRKIIENNSEDKTIFDLMFDRLIDAENFKKLNVTEPGLFWYKNTTENFFKNKDKVFIIKSDRLMPEGIEFDREGKVISMVSAPNHVKGNLKAAYIILKTKKEKESDIIVHDNLFFEVIQFSERSMNNPEFNRKRFRTITI